ncbi:MAG: RT0821/Lpp0805 family surface protein [Xanthobacteraceae bacterium]
MLSALVVSGRSYRLYSLSSQDDGDPPTTSSIVAPAGQAQSGNVSSRQVELARNPARGRATDRVNDLADDLAYARAAVSDALARAGKDSSFPWENPGTGAGGNITPLATSYTEGGLSCRDFLASYVHGGSQDSLQGAACRTDAGAWEIRRLKPLGRG